jgi:hypothetical protein
MADVDQIRDEYAQTWRLADFVVSVLKMFGALTILGGVLGFVGTLTSSDSDTGVAFVALGSGLCAGAMLLALAVGLDYLHEIVVNTYVARVLAERSRP